MLAQGPLWSHSEKLTSRATAPLGFGDVDIGVHDDVLGSCCGGDSIPDLKPGGVLGPARVLLNDLFGYASAVGVAQGIDHGNFKWNIHALTVVDLVDHFDCICPTQR